MAGSIAFVLILFVCMTVTIIILGDAISLIAVTKNVVDKERAESAERYAAALIAILNAKVQLKAFADTHNVRDIEAAAKIIAEEQEKAIMAEKEKWRREQKERRK